MSDKKLTWDKLFLNGSVVGLTNSLWRARVQIKASDLGIEDTDAVRTALSLGCHRLMPLKSFEEITRQHREASKLIDYYSVNFGLIRGARYVPEKNLPILIEELKKAKERFYLAVDSFMNNYEKTKDEMLPIIEKALLDAANDPIAAVNAFNRIKQEYPLANEVRSKFSLGYSVYAIRSAQNEGVANAAAEESEGVKSIIADMVKQLRDDLTCKLSDILKIVNDGGKLNDKSIEAANNILNRVDSLNVLNDRVLSDQINAFRKALASVTDGKYDGNFVVGLDNIKKTLETSVEEAIKDAEESLTGVGKRKLNIVPPVFINPENKEEQNEQAPFDFGSL